MSKELSRSINAGLYGTQISLFLPATAPFWKKTKNKKNIKRGKKAIINCAFIKMFRVTSIVYLRTFFFHACMLLCLSECDKISRWPVLHFKVHIYTTLNIMYQRKYFCINIKFPNVLYSKHIFPYWFKYICKKPTFSGFLYKKLVFSLPK